MTALTARRSAAVAMAGAAGLAIAGFTVLGSIFDYPAILEEPTEHILAAFRASETGVRSWFLVLTIGAALLAPIAVVLGRIAGGRRGQAITWLGIAAATVQTIGLSRWVLWIPGISDRAIDPGRSVEAHHSFERLHFWLGVVVGETIGYTLTAAFTILVVRALAGGIGNRWLGRLGYCAAGLVATGVVIPLGITVASLTNFVGYIAWCGWLIAMSVAVWRSGTENEVGALARTSAQDGHPARSQPTSGR